MDASRSAMQITEEKSLMKRRDFMRNAAMTAAGITVLPSQKAEGRSAQKQGAGSNKIHYEVHGNPRGKPLFLGFPMMASYGDIFGKDNAKVLSGFLERLTDRYRVLVADYPNIGMSHTPPAAEMTADRVCADLLSVASEAGFDRFAYWGYSWGGGVGILLASRSDRVSALVRRRLVSARRAARASAARRPHKRG